VTIGLTTSDGAAVFGTPRETFAFTGLSLGAGTDLSDLDLVSDTDFDAIVSSNGTNSATIGINSFDTRGGIVSATATFALPVAGVQANIWSSKRPRLHFSSQPLSAVFIRRVDALQARKWISKGAGMIPRVIGP
jgi:hypothetical protein